MKLFKSTFKILFDFFEILIICTAVFLIIYFFVGQLLEVTGDSMYPTFHDKEQIIAEKLSIKMKGVKRGEVLIFEHPSEKGRLLIKRLIGLPGETIKIQNGKVFIDNVELKEPYLSNVETEGQSFLEEGIEYEIPKDSYVMMGDNRPKSTDSREWGYVKKELIVGRGVVVYYPISRIRLIGDGLF
ncbi:signal peptidase I [candidate division WWE3 bacterium]|uniref:Signal peptidase I n=1 Tax=candidate division WWE3 bacterium TaxID=2053526 RepID=A0A7X9E6U8_UNCKA|nr:signal peptidase I [candidate division WWE3 bacterium]